MDQSLVVLLPDDGQGPVAAERHDDEASDGGNEQNQPEG